MNFDQGKSMVEVYPSVSVGISLGKKAFLVAQMVKNSPAVQDIWVRSLG